MGEETFSVLENWGIRLRFQIKVRYMYTYLLYAFWKQSSKGCILLKQFIILYSALNCNISPSHREYCMEE